MGAELFSYATLFGFLFALARISGVFAFMPLAVFPASPQSARIVLSLTLTLMLRGDWKAPPGVESSLSRVLAGVAGEMGLGLAIGVSLAIVIEVFKMAAQAISLPAGLGYASTIDPASGADSTVLLIVAELTAALLFFVSGADRLFIKALAESLRLAPPASFSLNKDWGPLLIHFFGSIFSVGLRLAAPVIALLLLGDASLAVLSRTQPQLHVVHLTMPVKLAATMLILSVTVGIDPGLFESLMTSWSRLIEGILRSAH